MNSGLKKHTVLVVDDQQFIRHIYTKELSQKGYRVVAAASGLEALEKLKESAIDLILMDAVMPVMDGFQTCMKIKKDPLGKKIPVIFLTANSDKDSVIKAVQAGGNDFSVKSSEFEGLFTKISKHLKN